MPTPEGLTIPFDDESSISSDHFERFSYTGEDQLITYKTSEFSAVCPFSGLPDYGIVEMHYIPDQYCIELKSLKYYLLSYRQVGIYQEHATNRLFTDIYTYLKPKYMKLTTIYNTRGGIDTTCCIEKGTRVTIQ